MDSWPGRPGYIAPGGTATLRATQLTGRGDSIDAQGNVQWYFNGAPLAGATRATLTLSALTAAQTGTYAARVIEADTTAAVDTNTITLNVLPAPAGSVVDTTFVSALTPAGGSITDEVLVPLADGGCVTYRVNLTPIGRPTTLYRVHRDGRAEAIYGYGGSSGVSGPAAVLSDGTLLMAKAPHRIVNSTTPVPGFSTLAGIPASASVGTGALQADGRLLVSYDNRLFRYTASGAADSSFSSAVATLSSISFVAVDSQQRIVVAGGGSSGNRVLRLNSSGSIDPSFTPIAFAAYASPWLLADDSLVIPTGRAYVFQHFSPTGSALPDWDLSALLSTSDANRLTLSPSGDFYIARTGLGVIRIKGAPQPTIDPTFFSVADEAATLTALTASSDGGLFVAGIFSSWAGHATSSLVRLDPSRTPPQTAPVVVTRTTGAITGGATVTVRGAAIGTEPLSYEWLTLPLTLTGSATGALPAVTNTRDLTFPSFAANNLGRYQLRVTGPGGSALGPIVSLSATSTPRLRNLSSRTMVGAGEDLLIAGLTLETNATFYPRRLLLRGAGPALAQFGVRPVLANPVLTLLRADGSQVQRNDDWVDDPFTRNYINKAAAFPFTPGSADSIVINEAPGGSYTVQLRDTTGQSGVGLIESYDVGDDTNPANQQYGEFTNLSLRGKAGAGDASLIAGFIIDDPQNLGRPLRVLVRAVGPTLSQYGVTTPLPNPRLTLYNGASVAFANNDDWFSGTDAAQIAATAKQVGAFDLPAGSKDSALLMDLPPGAYTAIVTDASGAAGIALIELYRVK